MDASEYSGFLLLLEETRNRVGILHSGAKGLPHKGVRKNLHRAEISMRNAIQVFREHVHRTPVETRV